jgi:hypothetical protein
MPDQPPKIVQSLLPKASLTEKCIAQAQCAGRFVKTPISLKMPPASADSHG